MPSSTIQTPTSPAALVGFLVGERYRLEELLGEEPLFAVFRATDQSQQRPVTVKTLLPRYAAHTEIITALRKGIGQVLSLAYAGIARPLDAGVDQGSGIAFYVAEESAGDVTLKDRIAQAAPLPLTVAVDVAITLAEALEFAAARALVHGDVRPVHVLTESEKPIKLAAWGIAEAQNVAASENQAVLAPAAPYTAPEIWATGTPSAAGDLYALGIILYQMLTGDLPFGSGGDTVTIARRHAEDTIPSLKPFLPTIPRAIDGLVQKLLAKRPADRYANPTALLEDLRAIRDALRFGRSLAWSPLDEAARPDVPNPDTVRGTWSETGTTVMPVAGSAKPVPVPPNAVTAPVAAPTPIPVAMPIENPIPDITDDVDEDEAEENENLPAAPAPRRGRSFAWLLTLNLILLIALVWMSRNFVDTLYIALTPATDVIVPNLVGKSLTEAKALGTERKFVVDIVEEQYSDKYAEDTIYQMRPEPGRHIRQNKAVTVWVSKGPKMVTVPDVYDVSFDKAQRLLEAAGLRVGEKKFEYDPLTAKGNVLQQVPAANDNQRRGTKVDLTLSKGPEPVETVPDVPTINVDTTPAPDTTGGTTGSTTPPSDTTGAKEQSLTVQYAVPKDASTHIIRVDVVDTRGTNTVETKSYNAGDTVSLDVLGYGKKITFRVYDNDVLQQEITGPPWTAGKN